jgi:hypothetical protein
MFRLTDDGEGRQDLVIDQGRHGGPVPTLGEPVQLGVQVTPAMQVEHRRIRGGASVEGDLLAHSLQRFQVSLLVSGRDN